MVGQDGASSSFSCTHARPHRITGDDFLQIYQNAAKEGRGKIVTKTLLDAYDLQKVGGEHALLQFLIDLTPQTPPTKSNNSLLQI